MDVGFSARELHERTLKEIRAAGVWPPGVLYPDGFVAGRGDWASQDRRIPSLHQWKGEMEGWSTLYLQAMSTLWDYAGSAVLMDYRGIDLGHWNAGDKMSIDRKHPGLFERSGAAFCFRQSSAFDAAIDEDKFGQEVDEAYAYHGYELTLDGCRKAAEAVGVKFDPFMFQTISDHGKGSYPQKSVAKTLTDDRGSIVKAAPWSWADFERYSEEMVFGFAVAMGINEIMAYDPGAAIIYATRLLVDENVVEKWARGPHGGQIGRVVWEYGSVSPDVIREDSCAMTMAHAAMYSISRGGDRDMYRKLDAYLDGGTPYKENGRGGRRRR